jgi:hypothetical protein
VARKRPPGGAPEDVHRRRMCIWVVAKRPPKLTSSYERIKNTKRTCTIMFSSFQDEGRKLKVKREGMSQRWQICKSKRKRKVLENKKISKTENKKRKVWSFLLFNYVKGTIFKIL